MDFEDIAANIRPARAHEFMALSGKGKNLRFFSERMAEEAQASQAAVAMGDEVEVTRASEAAKILYARFQRELHH